MRGIRHHKQLLHGALAVLLAALLAWQSASQAADRLQDRRTQWSPAAAGAGEAPVSSGNSSLLELLQQVEALQNEVQDLRNQVEIQGHQLKRLQEQQRDVLRDMDKRLSRLERGSPGSAPLVAPASALAENPGAKTSSKSKKTAKTAKAPKVSKPVQDSRAQEQRDYDSAFNYMKQGFYQQATKAFRQFLERYPRSALRANAQYWIAEANYVVRNFKVALEEFNNVIKLYPKSPKVADAMLKIGYTYYELEDWGQARKSLNAVVKRYPNSRLGKSAEQRLAKMKKEGH